MSAARALLLALALAGPVVPAGADAPTIAAMRHHRRVLILASPSAADPRLAQQFRALAARRGARDRDLGVVELIGSRVTGAGDRARLLRRQWRLPPGDFQAVLIGKDGREALRSPHPLSAAALRQTIDAMPMRRAGQR